MGTHDFELRGIIMFGKRIDTENAVAISILVALGAMAMLSRNAAVKQPSPASPPAPSVQTFMGDPIPSADIQYRCSREEPWKPLPIYRIPAHNGGHAIDVAISPCLIVDVSAKGKGIYFTDEFQSERFDLGGVFGFGVADIQLMPITSGTANAETKAGFKIAGLLLLQGEGAPSLLLAPQPKSLDASNSDDFYARGIRFPHETRVRFETTQP